MGLKIVKAFFLSSLLLLTNIEASSKTKSIFKGDGIELSYNNEYDEKQKVTIKRWHNNICSKVNGGVPNNVWGGDYANKAIPKECKKTFITTIGKISPIKIKGVETYGELEVIEYMKKAQTNKKLLLVDARLQGWYKKSTIPMAINLPFKSFNPKHQDFEIVMDNAGVEYEDGVYNFKNAKTLLLFCNGAWCPQSTWAIEELIKIGYPKQKLIWYRGGMYGWTMLNLTTVKP